MAADMREATLDRRAQEAEEWQEMEREDDRVFRVEEAERVHKAGGCLFCDSVTDSRDLGRYLAHMCGAPQHVFDPGTLHVVSRVLAMLDAEGRRAHGMFSLLGDAAFTYAVVDKCFGLRYAKSKASDARQQCTAWTALARVFASNVPKGLVQFPASIDPGTTRTGGEALEALAGAVSHELGIYHAQVFTENVGVYSTYKF